MIGVNRRRYMGGGVAKPLPNWFRLTAIEDCVFTLTIPSGLEPALLTDVSYSLDEGATWTTTLNVASTQVVVTTQEIKAGDSVIWKGHALRYAQDNNYYARFTGTGKFNASGNLAYLYSESDTISYIYERMFSGLFYNSTTIVSAKDLIFPLAEYTNGAKLIGRVQGYMFQGCTNLEEAPIMPLTTLTPSHFARCFQGCSKLDKITMLATDISANNCLYSWVQSVAASGTFVKAASMTTLPTGVNGIPSGWTVEDYVE